MSPRARLACLLAAWFVFLGGVYFYGVRNPGNPPPPPAEDAPARVAAEVGLYWTADPGRGGDSGWLTREPHEPADFRDYHLPQGRQLREGGAHFAAVRCTRESNPQPDALTADGWSFQGDPELLDALAMRLR